jgi:pimeloyl-ACP methyl ester carboxylesterase
LRLVKKARVVRAQIPVDESWIKRVKEDKNSPFSEYCLSGIIKEFDFVNLYPDLEKIKAPIVLLKGAEDGSHVEQEDIKDYKSLCANFKTIVLPNSGHGISDADEVILWETIRDFYPSK